MSLMFFFFFMQLFFTLGEEQMLQAMSKQFSGNLSGNLKTSDSKKMSGLTSRNSVLHKISSQQSSKLNFRIPCTEIALSLYL